MKKQTNKQNRRTNEPGFYFSRRTVPTCESRRSNCRSRPTCRFRPEEVGQTAEVQQQKFFFKVFQTAEIQQQIFFLSFPNS